MINLNVKQQQQLIKLAKKYQLELLFVFGSMARGDDTASSDIDLGYSTTIKLTLQQQFALQESLQQILQLQRPIDLINLAHATPLLAYQIIREGQVLYALANAEDSFYRRTVKQYIDARPLIQATQQYVQAYAHH